MTVPACLVAPTLGGGTVTYTDIAFVSVASNNYSNNTGLVLDKPAGVSAGNILIAAGQASNLNGNSGTLSAPAGWSVAVTGKVFYKIADGTEGASFDFGGGDGFGAAIKTGGIACFSGAADIQPLESASGSGTAAAITFSSVAVRDGGMSLLLMTSGVAGGGGNPGNYTFPAGWTALWDLGSYGGSTTGGNSGAGYKLHAADGTTGSVDGAQSTGAGPNWGSYSISFRPDAA